jgi:hypothetical protein
MGSKMENCSMMGSMMEHYSMMVTLRDCCLEISMALLMVLVLVMVSEVASWVVELDLL